MNSFKVDIYTQIDCKREIYLLLYFQGQIGLEPVIVNGLLSADFYCRACENVIFKGLNLTFTGTSGRAKRCGSILNMTSQCCHSNSPNPTTFSNQCALYTLLILKEETKMYISLYGILAESRSFSRGILKWIWCLFHSGHQSVIEALSRKGIHAVDVNQSAVTENSLLSNAPFKLVSIL